MNINVFDLNQFNIIEDNENYYLFRALNKADHDDLIQGKIIQDGNIEKIRTDRERWEFKYGRAKYREDSTISLEEVYDHIKMKNSKETNCISLSSNSNVTLDYGSGYFDDYLMIKVPKNNQGNVYHAGQYMLTKVVEKINEVLTTENIESNIRDYIKKIDSVNNNEELLNLVSKFVKNYDKNIMNRFQTRQYFNQQQQLEYNRVVAKATILELTDILPSILPEKKDNSNLLSTIGNAFSSSELIHYKDLPGTNIKPISKKMLNLVAIVQQLKDKGNTEIIKNLESKLITMINENYDIEEIDGKVVLTNGTNIIDCNFNPDKTVIFNDYKISKKLLSLEELYNMTSGCIDYKKATKTIEFCYSLALAKKESYEYSNIVSAIMGNDYLTKDIIEKTFTVNSSIIDRGNNNGYKLCETVNIGMNNENNNFYSLSEQKKFISIIQNLSINQINSIIESKGLGFREYVIKNILTNEPKSKNEFYAESILEEIDYKKIYIDSINQEDFNKEQKDIIIKEMSSNNIVRLYKAFVKMDLSHHEISNCIFNLMIEKTYKGYTFSQLCELDNIEEFVKENINKFNRNTNIYTLNKYFGILDNSNHIENSHINLRDYQQHIKNEVDTIYNGGRRFAGVVLPTGGGKSFIAMSEMLERKDANIVYIAPRKEIIRQFKHHIIKYIAGLEPEKYSDEMQNQIVKSCFPHLEFYCYQGLDSKEEERLKQMSADYIILDELHRIGAKKWNPAVKSLLKNNSKSKVLGITATPVRDEYEEKTGENYFGSSDGDMMKAIAMYLDDYTEEELDKKKYLACDINIIDAIQEGYVICPNIVSFDYYLEESDEYKDIVNLSQKVRQPDIKKTVELQMQNIFEIIENAKLTGMDTILNNYIVDKTGKYILFIPRKPADFDGKSEEYIENYIEEFKNMISKVDAEPYIDYIHSGRADKENSDAMRKFNANESNHLKVLVAIDMLNEGVHLDKIKGSFNFRRIDKKHLILSLQQLGRVIHAVDPEKEIKPEDIPVVFDKYNIYSNLDMDRMVNRTNSTSDLEKLKNIIFWINKYGRIPQTDSENTQEQRKALSLKKIKQKYGKYINEDLSKFNLSKKEEYVITEILKLSSEINLWDIEFKPLNKEKERKIERVNIFKVSATQESFLQTYNNIKSLVGVSALNMKDRGKNVLYVLDILSEYNLELSPNTITRNTITRNTILNEFLDELDNELKEKILYELKGYGIKENYTIGSEYNFARECFYNGKNIFNEFEANPEDISKLRRYGILINDESFKIIDNNGFIIAGPKRFRNYHYLTGELYDQKGANISRINKYNFDVETKVNIRTNSIYDEHGFDCDKIHKKTKTIYDEHGFNIDGIHKDTGERLNSKHFDIDGIFYEYDKENDIYTTKGSHYDNEGYDINGYNKRNFDRNGIHSKTKEKYDEFYFDKEGYYWKLTSSGKRIKTNKKYNDENFNRNGDYIEVLPSGKEINKGPVYDKHGFFYNGIHYRTHTKYDERGFDKEGYWYRTDADGNYVFTGSKFNVEGWDIDGLTQRYDAYGNLFLDYVDEHGFDENRHYHNPIKPYDEDGFKELNGGTMYYNKKAKNGQNRYYDIHGFDAKGIHNITKTHLNPQNFDINGYWYKEENGKLINTYSYTNDEGWTIDKRKIIYDSNGNIEYAKYVDGFNSEGLYRKNGKILGRYNEYGFDCHGIHEKTGTHLDESNFDKDGNWYKEENGTFVNTHQKYDDTGWTRNHTHISTDRIFDSHGFNYMHLYLYKSTLRWDNYDSHGFDYKGIHKTTGKTTNKNHFDQDGYWYKEENGVLIKTESKYDAQGYDIDRLDKYKFSKNGYYKGRRKKHDEKGFDCRGIHYLTNEKYDLKGRDRDGNLVKGIDFEKIKRIEEKLDSYRRVYFEDFITPEFIDDLLECYDETNEELIHYYELEDMILDILTSCINENEDYYTEEEVIQKLTELARESSEKRNKEELYEDYYGIYYQNKFDNNESFSSEDVESLRHKTSK